MANLLSLRLGWSDVTPLFSTAPSRFSDLRQALDDALDEVRQLPGLEDCDDVQLAMPALDNANDTAGAMQPYNPKRRRTWTDVTVSKVLHRLAPVVPIIDSSVKAFYATAVPGRIRQRMRDDLCANRDWMTELAKSYPVHEHHMPLTRVADILIWMDSRASSTTTAQT
ncbi:hypothetical protein GCM10010170_100070 [Dactylosporangium salmoneum]|uniref:Uncharacterized protein n=2 Tax=Dactylosporangium salmoneum TaxID=53361 RepID=A0ABN3HWA3_9ACTN